MTNTYSTLNPLGSKAPKDLYDNASNFDDAMNSPSPSFQDRFNIRRQTWAGMEFEFEQFLIASGYEYTVPLTYQAGIIINRPNQVFLKDGNYYRSGPTLTLPYTTTGVWASEQALFVPIGDVLLRSELLSVDASKGAALVYGAIRYVTNLAELKTLPKTGGTKRAQTSGWGVAGDGGGGTYRLDEADTTSAGDDFLIILATDGGRWKLTHNGVVSLRQAGAGVDATVCTARVNAAFAAVDAFGYPELYAPAGVINIDGAGVTCTGKPICLRGAGKGLSQFRYDGTGWAMSILPSDIQQNVTLHDFAILPNNASVASGRPLRVVYPTFASWSGKTVDINNLNMNSSLAGPVLPHWAAGMYFSDCWNGVVRNVWFTGKPNDWLTTASFIELGANCTDFVIDGVHGYFCINWLTISGYCEGVSVTNSTAVKVYRGVQQVTSSFLNLRFRGNHVNAVATCFNMNNAAQNQINDNLLYLTDAASVSFGNFFDCTSGNYSNNICIAPSSSPDGFSFSGAASRNKVVGNSFEGTTSGVLLSAGSFLNRVAMTTRFLAGSPVTPVVDSGTNNTVTT